MRLGLWAVAIFCTAFVSCSGNAGGDAVDDAGLQTDGGVFMRHPDAGQFDEADAGVMLEPDAGLTPADAGMSRDDAGVTMPPFDAGVPGPDDGGVLGLDARPANTTCVAPAPPPMSAGATAVRVFTKLTFNNLVGLTQPPGDPTRLYVLERAGTIRTFPNTPDAGTDTVTEALDLTSKVNTTGEGGLLGFAFHPNWGTNHELFIAYTETRAAANTLRLVVSRIKSTDGLTFDASSEEPIIKIDKPADNHNGGDIHFGPDGYLYLGIGDGGGGSDTFHTGSRLSTLLSKMIRIDVNVPAAQKYAIPASNPFAADGVVCNRDSSEWDVMPATVKCAEIYASGFRNPWRFSFDTENGDLWVGDVGQAAWEEVNKVTLGGNYGWSIREGARCFNAPTCDSTGLIDPIVEYPHSGSGPTGIAITGGFVYRGTSVTSLIGKYLFTDYLNGEIWTIDEDPSGGAASIRSVVKLNKNIAAFGQTLDGEVYPLDFNGGIYKMAAGGTSAPDTFPKTLSATGCFKASDPKQTVPALIPYAPQAQLWSDNAEKHRYFAIPDGTKITALADGDFDLPSGSVTVKTFFLNGKRIETRLFMRHSSGDWAGYSYEWNDAETDATLLSSGKTKTVGTQTWTYPSRAQCMACHTAAANRTLGLEAAQLNHDFTYPTGRTRNQLSTLERLGYFTAAVPAVRALADPFGSEPVESRARSYLHANCSNCHRLNAGEGPQDFRFSLPTAETNSCNVPPSNGDLGVTGAKIFVPGDPGNSLISLRMKTLGANRMPPLGSAIVHTQGTGLIDSWINSMTQCPQ